MDLLKGMKNAMMALMCTVALVGFTGCNDDEDTPQDDSKKAESYQFELTLTKVKGSDHADVINTTYEFIDHQGKPVNNVFNEKVVNSTNIKSQPYTTLPGELKVTVKQTLKDDITLDKEEYNLGIGIAFEITSMNKDKGILDHDYKKEDVEFTLGKEDLAKYPGEELVFHYMIDENGKITNK